MIDMNRPHRRYNPLTGEWVLVSPHRAQRPWLGQVEKTPPENLQAYDPGCYLCPGNARVGGAHNPDYRGTFVFDNDFPALLPPEERRQEQDLEDTAGWRRAQAVSGRSRVVCFSPRHDLSLPELSESEVEGVIRTWSDQTADLGRRPDIAYVQVFENKGAMMGASNPHPHSQIWATNFIPNEPAKEIVHMKEYLESKRRCLLCDVLAAENSASERVVAGNAYFTALAPFWAIWPFELLVISQRHVGSLTELSAAESTGLAQVLRNVTTLYDNLFEISFPYSMGFHQSPTDGEDHSEAHLHLHFYPPLLRSATVRKFMVGFEMLGMPQRDLTPEMAASRLRNMSPIHYRSA